MQNKTNKADTNRINNLAEGNIRKKTRKREKENVKKQIHKKKMRR